MDWFKNGRTWCNIGTLCAPSPPQKGEYVVPQQGEHAFCLLLINYVTYRKLRNLHRCHPRIFECLYLVYKSMRGGLILIPSKAPLYCQGGVKGLLCR